MPRRVAPGCSSALASPTGVPGSHRTTHGREAAIEIAWGLVLWAGFVATLAVSWFAAVARWIGLTRLEPALLLGCLVLARADGLLTRAAGVALYLLCGVVLLPAAYGAAFEALHRADALLGMLFGAVQAVAAGLGLAAAGRWGRCPRYGPAGSPGLFGWRLGSFTPAALVVANLFYGALLGFVYVTPGR
ncbi:MAG TPA: hypothetical protein VF192_15230 [Longimicrobiales bacterium]